VGGVFLTVILRAAHTQRNSTVRSMRRGQRTFRPDRLAIIRLIQYRLQCINDQGWLVFPPQINLSLTSMGDQLSLINGSQSATNVNRRLICGGKTGPKTDDNGVYQ